jgi:acid stress chaperone HdeB
MISIALSAMIGGAAALGGTAAEANKLNLATITCSDYSEADSKNETTIAIWLDGYYMDEDDDAIIDFDKLNNLGNALVKYCAAHPEMKLSDAAEKIMGKDTDSKDK